MRGPPGTDSLRVKAYLITEHQSVDLGKFRIKSADREVEYEGEDSTQQYKSALEWIDNRSLQKTHVKELRDAETGSAGGQKEGDAVQKSRVKRGRGQAALAKSKVEGALMPAGFLDEAKSNEEVTAELGRRGWPIPGKRVFDAMLLLLKEEKIDRFGTRGNYKYQRRVRQEKGKHSG